MANLTVTGTPALAVVGKEYSFKPAVSGGVAPYTWTLKSGAFLPTGLSLNASTGEVSGTPTQAKDFPFELDVVDSTADTPLTGSLTPTVTVASPITLASTGSQLVVTGKTFTYTPTYTGGHGTAKWTTADTFPADVSLNGSTGAVSGTVSATGATVLHLTLTDDTGTATQALTLNAVAPLTVAAKGGVTTTVNTTYDYTPSATGGSGTRVWSFDPALPKGVGFSTVTGEIKGSSATAGDITTTLTVTDDTGSASQAVTISVNDALTITGVPTAARVGEVYSFAPTVTGGSGGNKAFVLTGSLPAGLSFDNTTGKITGTPTIAGSVNLTISVDDGVNNASLNDITLTVGAGLGISPISSPIMLAVGAAAKGIVFATTDGTAVTWSVAPSLPAALTLDPATGIVSGSVSAVQPVTKYVLTATDANGGVATADFSLGAVDGIVIAPVAHTDLYVNDMVNIPLSTTGGSGAQLWRVLDGELPYGTTIAIDGSAIIGPAVSAGAFIADIGVLDDTGSAQTEVSIEVANHVDVSISGGFTYDSDESVALKASYTGGLGAVTLSPLNFPTGLKIADDGTISGTVAPGTYTIGVVAKDSGTDSKTATIPLTIIDVSDAALSPEELNVKTLCGSFISALSASTTSAQWATPASLLVQLSYAVIKCPTRFCLDQFKAAAVAVTNDMISALTAAVVQLNQRDAAVAVTMLTNFQAAVNSPTTYNGQNAFLRIIPNQRIVSYLNNLAASLA